MAEISAPAPAVRKRDRDRSQREILEYAIQEFAENGLSGSSVETIAERAGVTKRLVFYYFKTKEGLFTAALEASYAKMRKAEQELNLDNLEPQLAIRRLAEFTFDFDNANPEFVRLVLTENIHRGRHMSRSIKAKAMTRPIIDQIERLLDRGVRAGVFRPSIDATELHMTLSALCFFSVGNRHTFEPQFNYDMTTRKAKAARKREIAEIIWRYVRADAGAEAQSEVVDLDRERRAGTGSR